MSWLKAPNNLHFMWITFINFPIEKLLHVCLQKVPQLRLNWIARTWLIWLIAPKSRILTLKFVQNQKMIICRYIAICNESEIWNVRWGVLWGVARRSEQSCCATVAGLCAVSIPSICREERLKGFRGLEGLKVFSAQSPVVCPLPSVKPRIVDISGAVLSNLALDTGEVTDRCIISANNWTAVREGGSGQDPYPSPSMYEQILEMLC